MGEVAELKQVEVSSLQPHPDNPRLVIRQDVVDGIAANLNGVFPEKHAIHVRPIEGGYQVLSGHHRLAAAKARGMTTIPAWVEDLDDNTAFMELVLSNNQGELSPLEIGMHALKAVPKSDGGRGKRGGLSEYARLVGKAKSKITEYRQAAEVVASINCSDIGTLLDKTHHLAAIHAAGPPVWNDLVEAMLSRDWTVSECKAQVSNLAEFDHISNWPNYWDINDAKRRSLRGDFSARTARTILAQIEATNQSLMAAHEAGTQGAGQEFVEFDSWLKSHITVITDRMVERYRRELEARLVKSRDDLEKSWCLGRWQDHIDSIKDGSIKLLLTDPPYGMEYQSNRRKATPKRDEISGDESLDETRDMLKAFVPKLATDSHILVFCHAARQQEVKEMATAAGLDVSPVPLIWDRGVHGMGDLSGFAPRYDTIVHARTGSAVLLERIPDVIQCNRASAERHPTEKPLELLKRLIEVTTAGGELVADPFGGVASTLVAAKVSGRQYWGCELDEKYHATGAGRLNHG